MKTDVLVLGGGLSALSAAYEVIKGSDLKVTLIQCGGGASPYIHGFCLPIGKNDSPELLLADTIVSGCGYSDPELAKTLCDESLSLLQWFDSLELELDKDGENPSLLKALGSSVPRIAGIQNASGPAVMARIHRFLRQNGRYTEYKNNRAMQLLNHSGRVVGAKCFDLGKREFYNIYAQTVILATGGFCNILPRSTNAPEMGGDGIAMAYKAGARLRDMEFIQYEPCVATAPQQVAGKGIITTMFYNGAVLRNKTGERFMLRYGQKAECVPKDKLSQCIANEGETVLFDATAVPDTLWQTVYKPYLQRYLNCGIDLRTTPVPVAPAAHTSCGGVIINKNCCTGVPGLLACGEVAGGLHGANRLGGNAGLETMVFGRIAGATAVRSASNADLLDEDDRQKDVQADMDISAMRKSLQKTLYSSLNVVRNEKDLTAGLGQLEVLIKQLGNADGSYEKLRLYNDLLTAEAALRSALERKMSVGCHFRSDSSEEAVSQIIVEETNGKMHVLRKEMRGAL